MGRRGTWLAVVAVVLFAGSSFALDAPSEYQMDAGIEIQIGKGLMGAAETTTTGFGGSFNYYFKKVQDDEKPFALQQFFQKASLAGVVLGTGAMTATGFEGTTAIVNIGAKYHLPVIDENLALALRYGSMKFEQTVGGTMEKDYGTLDFAVGYRVLPELDVEIEFRGFITDDAKADLGGTKASRLGNLNARYVLPIGEQQLDLLLGISLDADASDAPVTPGRQGVIEIGATYYIMKELGVGITMALDPNDSKTNPQSSFGINASYYVGPLAIDFAWTWQTSETKINGLTIGVKFRF